MKKILRRKSKANALVTRFLTKNASSDNQQHSFSKFSSFYEDEDTPNILGDNAAIKLFIFILPLSPAIFEIPQLVAFVAPLSTLDLHTLEPSHGINRRGHSSSV